MAKKAAPPPELAPHERPVEELQYDWAKMSFVPNDHKHAPDLQGAFVYEHTPEGVSYWWKNRDTDEGRQRWAEMTKLFHAQNPDAQVNVVVEEEDPAAITDAEVADDK